MTHEKLLQEKNVANFRRSNPVSQIMRWFQLAVPEPEPRNVQTQIGVHFEEVAEMMDVLGNAGRDFPAREQIAFARDVTTYIQRRFKAGDTEIVLGDVDRHALLDALCDQIVTAIGVAHMLGMDIEGALQEVADSNDSKFGPEGQPIFNEQRKVMKGPYYRAPDLTRFA